MGDGRIRSATDTGPGKVRRRTTAMASPLQGRMLMTSAQVAILKTFVETDLFGGVGVFDFLDPVSRTTKQVRFAETVPTWSHAGGDIFNVMLTLEILP
jgi:hypothetical protein